MKLDPKRPWYVPEYYPLKWKRPALVRWERVQFAQQSKPEVLRNLIEMNPEDCEIEKRELAWRYQGPDGPFR
jgi:hypothetical protein